MEKHFKTYAEAYALYSDIVSGRDKDRKNAFIFYEGQNTYPYVVRWESNLDPL